MHLIVIVVMLALAGVLVVPGTISTIYAVADDDDYLTPWMYALTIMAISMVVLWAYAFAVTTLSMLLVYA